MTTDSSQNSVAFAMQYSDEFHMFLQNLQKDYPKEIRIEIYDVINKLAFNLDECKDFVHRKFKKGKEFFVYEHPVPKFEITYNIDEENHAILFIELVTPASRSRKPLFISYSHIDRKWLHELKKWINDLEKNSLVSIWDDTQILAGARWREEINKALFSAKAALLLVSQDFLDSDFISKFELPPLLNAAKKEGVKILWIAIRESMFENTEISEYQALNTDPDKPLNILPKPKREKELKIISKKIRKAIEF